jgi:hypothetical protein
MDFTPSVRTVGTAAAMWDFMHECVFPAEAVWRDPAALYGDR